MIVGENLDYCECAAVAWKDVYPFALLLRQFWKDRLCVTLVIYCEAMTVLKSRQSSKRPYCACLCVFMCYIGQITTP